MVLMGFEETELMSEVAEGFGSEIRVHLVPPELNVSASAGGNGEGGGKKSGRG